MSTLLGPDLPSDDDLDSDYEQSEHASDSSSSCEVDQPGESKTDRDSLKQTLRVAKAEKLFAEMHQASLHRAHPKEASVLGGDLWELFNRPAEPPQKDPSLNFVLHQLDIGIGRASSEPETDMKAFKIRERSSHQTDISALLNAVDSEFIEVTEEAVFAGKTVSLMKKVSIHSEEAKRWLKKQQNKQVQKTGSSGLDSYLQSIRKSKTLNSMEKSAFDWKNFKDEHSLDFEKHREFLDRQIFLGKVGAKTDDKVREAKRAKID